VLVARRTQRDRLEAREFGHELRGKLALDAARTRGRDRFGRQAGGSARGARRSGGSLGAMAAVTGSAAR
jgi:hypothetical protein